MTDPNYGDYLANNNISIHNLIKLKYEIPLIKIGDKNRFKNKWERKKEYEIICLFREYNIRPNVKNNNLITMAEWVEAFNDYRLLTNCYDEKSDPFYLFLIRLNSMIMNNEILYEDRKKAKKIINTNLFRGVKIGK